GVGRRGQLLAQLQQRARAQLGRPQRNHLVGQSGSHATADQGDDQEQADREHIVDAVDGQRVPRRGEQVVVAEEAQHGRVDGYGHAFADGDGEHGRQQDQRKVGGREIAVGGKRDREGDQGHRRGKQVVGRVDAKSPRSQGQSFTHAESAPPRRRGLGGEAALRGGFAQACSADAERSTWLASFHISTSDPSSIRRLPGIRKKAVADSALCAMKANRRSRHNAMPCRCLPATTVSRERKNVVSIMSNGGPSWRHCASRRGTSGSSSKPKRSRNRAKPSPSAVHSDCSAGSDRGVSSVSTVSSTLRSCSTLLCLRLCSSELGIASALAVRNTAVPDTRWSGWSARFRMNGASARPPCWISRTTSSRPRRQVVIATNTHRPSASGNQPPCATLTRFALKKPRSTLSRQAPVASTAGRLQCHWKRATTSASKVVMTMVPVTAMP